MKNKRVMILTEAGKNIGYGHLTRCISLYQAFEEKGIAPELLIEGDKSIPSLIKGMNFQIFNWRRERSKLSKKLKQSSIIIIDSYLANKSIYEGIARNEYNELVAIDDYDRLDYPEGVVINPSIYGEDLAYSARKEINYLVGKKYIMLRKEFWNIPAKVINRELKNVLITFGGVKQKGLIHGIVRCLKNKFNFNLFITENKKIFGAKEMIELMLKADIAISGGGQTTYELARVGLPVIGICYADNQKLNLESWQRKGFVEYIGWHNDEGILLRLENAINKILPYEDRLRRSWIGKNCVDGKGAGNVVNKLLKIVNK
ncbi:MAG: UDP-2,4-diacetamido-2,4,6-trideoxy-beta-L-altropyranose hydrolase [Candidatus Omnitrophica bacterium]|nr:UDP-2,4-diacetamido-2,4,6-trideoxy-beta-L-altropyranose hydrolase [Candidatus Omnitrophota bacterium]